MKTLKGPAIFLAQFAGDKPPFNDFANICKWAADKGFEGVQVPTWDRRMIDLPKAAGSKDYCDELAGAANDAGVAISELSTHLQGQLVAAHPVYDEMLDGFAPPEVHGKPAERQAWAVQQLLHAAKASQHLGLTEHATFSGAFAWPFMYPFPQRPAGLIATAFGELAKRWLPLLDAFGDVGVDLCYEIHPGEDLHDGVTFEMFLERVNNHQRCKILYDPSHFVLQALDYLDFIDIYAERIGMFHVKDAELNPTGRQGVYGGYQSWVDRAGRFRSLGDGQVDFAAIFSKLAASDFGGWPVLEWECCLKDSEDGAEEGAQFIRDHIIQVTETAFDDFASANVSEDDNKRILGIG